MRVKSQISSPSTHEHVPHAVHRSKHGLEPPGMTRTETQPDFLSQPRRFSAWGPEQIDP